MDLQIVFEAHDDEFMKFDAVQEKSSQRPDLHAFLLLDRLLPGKRDLVSCAEHDEIWLDVDLERLAEVATEDHIVELIRCGVMYDSDVESLHMYV